MNLTEGGAAVMSTIYSLVVVQSQYVLRMLKAWQVFQQ